MSRSLARIRNLISEIEDIQRHGQQGSRSGPERIPLALAEKAPDPASAKEPSPATSSPVVTEAVMQASSGEERATQISSEPDPFDALVEMVDTSARGLPTETLSPPGKVSLQLSGGVILSVQIANSNERFELSQQGEAIVIRFDDGKAFHIPLKAVS